MGEERGTTHLHDLPEAILTTIFSLVDSSADARARNSMSLVCRRWRHLERSTRSSLSLRGNIRHLFLLPTCFPSVTSLDLSLLSPWGSSLRLPDPNHHLLAARSLARAFPSVASLSLYARDPDTLLALAAHWPFLRHARLVRWHQRPPSPPGSDFLALFNSCRLLSSLDLSSFYCWTEDLPAALQACGTMASLTRLDLVSLASVEGFKSPELVIISAACPNLMHLLAPCVFDPRYDESVADDTLLAIANCKGLSTLHLIDHAAISSPRAEGGGEDGFSAEDANITLSGLESLFAGLPLLEDLALDVCHNVREAGPALEALNHRCPRMKSLKLGQFHGVCRATALHLDGVAVCGALRSLSIKNSADLSDAGLVAIARGCSRLSRFELQGCRKVSQTGVQKLASILRSTLVDVSISGCKHLDGHRTLQALEPIRDRIKRLHVDCVWSLDDEEETLSASLGSTGVDDDLDELEDEEDEGRRRGPLENGDQSKSKKCRFSEDSSMEDSAFLDGGEDFWCRGWKRLRRLSLWVPVGELLNTLVDSGLESCPVLEEVCIKVEGDCRTCPKPPHESFGLDSLGYFGNLSKMRLDCSDVIGYALTAPMGQMDLSLWERFYLKGIKELRALQELDYWPPQDRDVNQRSLSLPAVGLLAECAGLRKLFIHGTTHEHFMRFLLNIPNLRDVQLREDYYPAPENDMSTEMRVDSCTRFEDALNQRWIPD